MRAALLNFQKIQQKYHTFEAVLIIGDMLELGNSSIEMHLNLIPIINKINPDLLITIGSYSKRINDKLKLTLNCYSYSDISHLIKDLNKFIKPNQIILLKGSNGRTTLK